MRLLALVMVLLCGCAYIPQPNVKFIAFGDSSTKEYPSYLAADLGVPENQVGNQYVSGEPTAEGLKRLNQFIAYKTFPNGEYFLYWEGGNDLIDLMGKIDPFLLYDPTDPNYPYKLQLRSELLIIQRNIQGAIVAAQSQNWKVFVGTYQKLMPMNCPAIPVIGVLLPGQAERANKYQELLNEAIKSVALLNGARTVDISAYNFVPGQYANCNHLNTEGNKIVSKLWAISIKN